MRAHGHRALLDGRRLDEDGWRVGRKRGVSGRQLAARQHVEHAERDARFEWVIWEDLLSRLQRGAGGRTADDALMLLAVGQPAGACRAVACERGEGWMRVEEEPC